MNGFILGAGCGFMGQRHIHNLRTLGFGVGVNEPARRCGEVRAA